MKNTAAKVPPPKTPEEPKIKPGETLFHGTAGTFKPGDIIDAKHSKARVTGLQEGKQYAFASTDPGEASFFGENATARGQEHHLYKVVPVDKYEVDPHMHNNTSRRSSGGFKVVEEVTPWSGESKAPSAAAVKSMTPAQKREYAKTGKVPAGVQLAYTWDDLASVIEMAAGL